MQETDKAWLAGFIDGDGCFHLDKQKRSGTYQKQAYYYCVRLSIANRDLITLKHIMKMYPGGSLTKRNLNKKHSTWCDAWQLRYSTKPAYKIMKDILPYLIMKQKQCHLCIEMCELKSGQKPCDSEYYNSKLVRYNEIFKLVRSYNKTGQEYLANNGVNSGKAQTSKVEGNPELSRVNGIKVTRKVQRLMGEQPYQ